MKASLWAITAMFVAAGAANADYTGFGSSGEQSVYDYFRTNYGGGSASQTKAQFQDPSGIGSPTTVFGAYTFTRIQDLGGTSHTDLHANTSASFGGSIVNDTRFADGTADVTFTIKHAGNGNTLGWVNHAANPLAPVTSSNFVPILNDTSIGATTSITLSSNFQLALKSNNTYWGSNAATNSDGLDHLLTWFVEGNGRAFFVVAWEDLPGQGADRDFNDWVGELQVVPLPPAAWAGLSSLAGVAGFGVIRRRRLGRA